ncbi:MAG: ThiF family adenylyltransferase [Deltaproteobacteria bacterium]|nr:ThiF family adenylyltransferase [Deltaproteobacteria bacterium]
MGPSSACFVVIGAGGLGCPALLALAAGGATRAVVVDHDRVEAHNLQRQVLYDVGDVGALKARAAARRLPSLHIEARCEQLQVQDVSAFVASLPAATVVLECTDQPALKFAVNDACLAHDVPLVIGAALGWAGQALAVRRGHACYRCIYEAPPQQAPRCDEAGVLGSGVGHIGMLMAHLALAQLQTDDTSAGQLWVVDLLRFRVQRLAPAARPACPAHDFPLPAREAAPVPTTPGPRA